jgi:Protein of unknown function (DUF3017)
MRHSAPSASRLRRQRRAAVSQPPNPPAPPDSSGPVGHPPNSDVSGAPGSRRAAAPGRQRWRQLPYVVALCCLALALIWMRQGGQNVKGGTLAVAGIVFAAALARLALPERRVGMLASRRRLTDVAVLAALGTGLLVAGLLLPAQH